MKRIFCLVLCMVMLLTGCSTAGSSAESLGPVKVTLWHYYGGDTAAAFSQLVQTFNETVGVEKGILIDAYSYGGVSELAEAVLDSANEEVGAPEMPDIFAAYSDNALRIDQLSKVAALDSYFTEEELLQYRPEFLEEGRISDDNALKIIPVAKSSEIIYINGTDFEPFSNTTGVTTDDFATWEGLVAAAETYYNWTDSQTEEPGDGKALFGMDSMANFMLVSAQQLGGEIFTIDQGRATVSLSKEHARVIWDNSYVPLLKGYFASVGRFRSDDVKFGELIMYVGSTSGANYFPDVVEKDKDSAYAIDCIAAPYPVYQDAVKNVVVQQGAGMVVSKSTPEREAASVEFLKWFTDTTQNQSFAVSTGYLPVENDSLNIDSVISKIIESGESINGPTVATANAIYPMLDTYALFADKPFNGSYDTRNVLDNCFSNAFAQRDEILLAIAAGEDPQTLYDQYTSDENFDLWYDQLIAQLEENIE